MALPIFVAYLLPHTAGTMQRPGSTAAAPQQRQQQQPHTTVSEEPCGDCAVEKVLTDGLCKQEFLAFDACYDANAQYEEPCMDLVGSKAPGQQQSPV